MLVLVAATMALLGVGVHPVAAAAAHGSMHRRAAPPSPSPRRPSFLLGLSGGDGSSVLGSLLELGAEDIHQSEEEGHQRKEEQQQPGPQKLPHRSQIQQEMKTTQLQQQEQQAIKKQQQHQGDKKPHAGGKGGMSPDDAAAAVGKLMGQLHNMTFLPLVPQEGASHPAHAAGNGSQLQQYLAAVRGDAWAQFKSLAVGYSGWLEHEYNLNHITDKLPLDLVKKVLDLGDRVNFLHVVGRRVDPGLANFLADKLQPLFDHFDQMTAGRLVGGSLANAMGDAVRGAAWRTLQQFVDHVLEVAGGTVTRQELQDFRKNLAKTSPLAAQGLAMLLDGPPPPPQDSQQEEGRSSRAGYREYHDGFGSHGSYDDSYHVVQSYGSGGYGGGGGGYSAGVHLDPYLILAGLGAAVLLAYLAYRVLVTTEAAARALRGGLSDLALVDLSDEPSVLSSLHDLLDDAHTKYDVKRAAPRDDMDDFTDALNTLWREHEQTDGCVRCALFDATLDTAIVGHSSVPALAT